MSGPTRWVYRFDELDTVEQTLGGAWDSVRGLLGGAPRELLSVLPLSDNSTTGVGTEVVSVGYPASVDLVTDASFNPSFKEGTISAEKTTEGGLLPVYEISAAVSGGMSGGPTVGLTGDVIGVNSFKIEGETQPFNFVQPSSNIDELLRAEGVENTLGPVTEQYRAGLAAYFAGDREVAIENFDAVLSTVPSHQFAQDYLQKAEELPNHPVIDPKLSDAYLHGGNPAGNENDDEAFSNAEEKAFHEAQKNKRKPRSRVRKEDLPEQQAAA